MSYWENVPQGDPYGDPFLSPYANPRAAMVPVYNRNYPELPFSGPSLSHLMGHTGEPYCNDFLLPDQTIDPSLLTHGHSTGSPCTDGTPYPTKSSGCFTQQSEDNSTQTSAETWPSEGPSESLALPLRTAAGRDISHNAPNPSVSQDPSSMPNYANSHGSRKRSQTAIDQDGASQGDTKQPKVISTSAGYSFSDKDHLLLDIWTKKHNIAVPSPSQLDVCVDMIIGSREAVFESVRKGVRDSVKLWFRENTALSEPERSPINSAAHRFDRYPLDQQSSNVSEAPLAGQGRVEISALDRMQRVEGYKRDASAKECKKRQDRPRGRYQCIYWCGFATDRRDDFKKHLQIKQPQKFWICTLCDEGTQGSGNVFHLRDKIRPHIKAVHKKTADDVINALIDVSEVVCPGVFHAQCGFCRHKSKAWDSSMDHLCDHFDGGIFQAIPCGKADWHPKWPRRRLPPCPCPSCASATQPAPDADDLDDPYTPDDPEDPADGDPKSNYRKMGQSQGPQPGSASGSFGRGNQSSGFRGYCTARQSQHRCPVFDRSEAVESIRRLKLPFRHVSFLGTGGTAIVDKIEHADMKLVFARKTITSCDADHLRRVKHEIDIMKKLSHPNLVRFVAAYKEEQAVHIIMTPAADCSLRQYLRSPETWYHQKLPSRAWYGALVSAVDYLHNTALAAHLDLKPENILLSSSHRYQVCISDFGSSKELSALTTTFLKVNGVTPMYCCPEGKERRAVGSKADVWSLGCIFTELLTVELGLTVTGLHAHLGLTSRVKSWSNTYQSKVAEMRLWIMGLRRNCEPLAQGILDVCQSMLNYDASSRPTASELLRSISLVYLQGSTYPQQDVHGRSQYVNISALLRSWGSLRWQWQFSDTYLGSSGQFVNRKPGLCPQEWSVQGNPSSCCSDFMHDELWQYDNVDMKGKLLESRSSVDLVGLGIWDEQALSAVPPTYHPCYEISIDTGCSSYLTSEQSLELRQLLGLEDPSDCYVLGTA